MKLKKNQKYKVIRIELPVLTNKAVSLEAVDDEFLEHGKEIKEGR